ncbi:hypothetical protein GQ600_7781 [Phytophthora cactorum]|nr:hypothetical protein GQ600_7781 [Phytophthora cactorum]
MKQDAHKATDSTSTSFNMSPSVSSGRQHACPGAQDRLLGQRRYDCSNVRRYAQVSPASQLTTRSSYKRCGCIATAALFASFSWDSAHQGSPSNCYTPMLLLRSCSSAPSSSLKAILQLISPSIVPCNHHERQQRRCCAERVPLGDNEEDLRFRLSAYGAKDLRGAYSSLQIQPKEKIARHSNNKAG